MLTLFARQWPPALVAKIKLQNQIDGGAPNFGSALDLKY
jgi:hypothetical protein